MPVKEETSMSVITLEAAQLSKEQMQQLAIPCGTGMWKQNYFPCWKNWESALCASAPWDVDT